MIREDLTGRTFERLTVTGCAGIAQGRSHWNCLCVCGNSVVVAGSKLKNGHTRSCGCIRKGKVFPQRRLPHGEAMRNRAIARYRENAKKRGLSFELSPRVAALLMSLPCHYCGRPPSHVASDPRSNGEFRHSGLDRIDNTLGYVAGNVVPCCMECNYRKGTQHKDGFLRWVQAIAARHGWSLSPEGERVEHLPFHRIARNTAEARKRGIETVVIDA